MNWLEFTLLCKANCYQVNEEALVASSSFLSSDDFTIVLFASLQREFKLAKRKGVRKPSELSSKEISYKPDQKVSHIKAFK